MDAFRTEQTDWRHAVGIFALFFAAIATLYVFFPAEKPRGYLECDKPAPVESVFKTRPAEDPRCIEERWLAEDGINPHTE